jgi:hypothetical protein
MVLVHGRNVQVTFDSNPNNDRSESALASNPRDPWKLVGSSKRFTNPAAYEFTLAVYASADGGRTWNEAPRLKLPQTVLGETIDGTSDPTVAFDDNGTAYLLGLTFHNTPPGQPADLLGMAVYTSRDNGKTWSPPNVIHEGWGDDKQSMASDLSNGHVYAVWDAGDAGVVFARTTDRGSSWKGTSQAGQGQPTGSVIVPGGNTAAITVDPDSQVHVFALGSDPNTGKSAILHTFSADGGDSFSAVRIAASGLTLLNPATPPSGAPVLPGGTFKVVPVPAATAGAQSALVIVWADFREGLARIYKRHSLDGGLKWAGAEQGEPLLAGPLASRKGLHDFHPQLATAPNGQIGCAFYEYGPMPGGELINVVLAISHDNGGSFTERVTVTDRPWDPAVDPPVSRVIPSTFIGDYFGLAANPLGFFPFWTDTRTGIQEIFTARVNALRVLAGYATGFNDQQHVIYIGTDNHVHELYYDNGWHHNDLHTQAAAGQPLEVAPGSALAGYATDFNDQQHVIYIGIYTDPNGGIHNHVSELYYDNGWHHNDLHTQAAAGQPLEVAPGSALAGYATGFNDQQHVIYIGIYTDPNGGIHNHVSELYYDNGWHHNDLHTQAAANQPQEQVANS